VCGGTHTRTYSKPRTGILRPRREPRRLAPQIPSRVVPTPLNKRLVFVIGKGGVGKSTVAVTVGLAAARLGKRTMVAELFGQERVQRLFGRSGEHFHEAELAPRLFTISIDPEHAMDEYLRVKAGALGHVLASSRFFQAFAMATPGMRELLSVGKIWELAQLERRTEGGLPYDLVVVDAPSTGHGVGLLRTPRTFADIARVGPIARQGRAIADTIADRRFTGVVAVTTPEEMPINETLSLVDTLGIDGLAVDLVVLNALYPARFTDEQVGELERALARTRSRTARSALKAALSEHARGRSQREQAARLREGIAAPIAELPYVFAEQLDEREIGRLAETLESQL
jgi:anion-transporting  ArsA/GET3 family ATPase